MSYHHFETWRTTPLQGEVTLSIIIPTYNEYGDSVDHEGVHLKDRIRPTLAAMGMVVSGLIDNWELIVSDDGSADHTADAVTELQWANLKVIRSPNTGKGGAVKRGMLAARGQYVMFADADNSTPIEQFTLLKQAIDQGADVAVGSRALVGSSVDNKSWIRKFISSGLSRVQGVLSGIYVRDTQCGFKMFTKDTAYQLFSRQQLNGFSFDLELLYLAQKLKYRIAEVPVSWYDAPGSKVNMIRDSIKFFKDILYIKKLDRQGAYSLQTITPPTPSSVMGSGSTLRSELQTEPQSQARRNVCT